MEFLNTHTNLPLDRLMQDLTNQGFHITPDMYVRVQTILQELGKEYYKSDEEDTYKKLAYIIAPIVVKNPQEQQIFDEVFDDYVEYLEQKARAFKASQEEVVETSLEEEIKPTIKQEWYRKPLIWLGVFGVLGLGIILLNNYIFYKKINQAIDNFPIQIDTTILDFTKTETETPSISQPIDTFQSELQITIGASDYIEFKGHQNIVAAIKFSPDGKYITTASHDKTARVWNIQTQEYIQFRGHEGAIADVDFSPDGKHVATASIDTTVRIWNIQTKEYIQLSGHKDAVRDIEFSPDGKYITTASYDSTVRVWNIQTKESTKYTGHNDRIWDVKFSPNGKYIATASWDSTARVWNTQTQEYVQFVGHRGAVFDVEFSPNGKYIATASTDNTARVWNIQTRNYTQLTGHRATVRDVEFSPDGKYIVTASSDNTARMWNIQTQDYTKFAGHKDWIWDVEFSPDGKYIATVSKDNTARVWNIQTQEYVQFVGHQGLLRDVEFSPDGKYIATASQDKTARIWNLYPKTHLNTQPTKKAYLYPILLFLLLTALATWLFKHLQKPKTSPFAPNKNAQAPYKIPFPEQAVIPATPQVYQLAKMLRQRQAGWRYRMDIPATVRATIAKGGFPVIRQRGNTRAPEYLFLIDLETPDAQQVSWLEYVLQLLRREEVLMAWYYFKQDPSWCWNREQPEGLDIDELHRRFPDHRLVIYGDGDYWLDSFEARTDERVLRDFPLWSQRALLTTVPPENWSYRERLLQQYFNLIPGDMKEPLMLASALMTQAEDFEQIRQDRSRSTEQFIEFNTLDDIRDFLQDPRLVDWLAATTVYPEPQWEITLAIGKALEQVKGYEGILTLPNLRRLTQIKWMNRDAFPENLRQDLLAHLHTRPHVAAHAREQVISLLQEAKNGLAPNSYAYTDAHIKLIQQQRKVTPVAREIEDEAIRLADEGLINPDASLSKIRQGRKFATIAGAALTAALLTLIMCTATLGIFPQIKEKWGLVETVSFDLPVRIDDPRFTNKQGSLGVKIVSENFERAFNVMANEDYLVRGIPVEFLDSMATIQTVCENDSMRLDSFILAPTPVQKFKFEIKRECSLITKSESTVKEVLIKSFISKDSLFLNTIIEEGVSSSIIKQIKEAVKYEIDLNHTLPGDEFIIVYSLLLNNNNLNKQDLLAIEYKGHEGQFSLFRYKDNFYDSNGNAFKKMFLRSPISLKIINSPYGQHTNPVSKKHQVDHGIIYFAPNFAPVFALADGIIVAKSNNPSNGNYIKIYHDEDYTTQYLHLSRFAQNLNVGYMIKQGKVIGYIGETGNVTAPLLCLRLLKNGQPIDFTRERNLVIDTIKVDDINAFKKKKDQILRIMNN